MKGIAEMFDELSGYDRYDLAIDIVGAIHRRKAVERMREWRKANPDKSRAQIRRSTTRYRDKNPDKVREWKRASYNRKYKQNPDEMRATWRKSQAKSRAKKRLINVQ